MAKKKKRRLFLRLIAVAIIIGLGLSIILVVYLASNNPPILKGEVVYDQPYKNQLSLDIYRPTVTRYERSPVVIFIHGGAWIAGRKESINFNRFNGAINMLRSAGYTVIAPEYTLATANQAPFPYCIEDAFGVLEWLNEHSEEYNLDLQNIGVFGESAGAHIGLMISYARPDEFDITIRKPKINYVVSVYGPTELNYLYRSATIDSLASVLENLPEPLSQHLDLSQRLFGFDPTVDTSRTREFANRFSPLSYLNNDIPPTLLIHGLDDQLVPYDQSTMLADSLEAKGLPFELHKLEGVNHGFIGASEFQRDSIQHWIADFIEKNYNEN